MRNKSPLLEETIEEHSKDDMSWITSPEKESFRYAERIGDYFVVRSVYGTNEEYCKYRVYDYKTAKKISEITVNAYTCYKDEKSALIFKKKIRIIIRMSFRNIKPRTYFNRIKYRKIDL